MFKVNNKNTRKTSTIFSHLFLVFQLLTFNKNRFSRYGNPSFRISRRRCSVEKDVLKKMFKFRKKTPVLESIFNISFRLSGMFCEICETFKNIYFEEHLRTTALALYGDSYSNNTTKLLSSTPNRFPNCYWEIWCICLVDWIWLFILLAFR